MREGVFAGDASSSMTNLGDGNITITGSFEYSSKTNL